MHIEQSSDKLADDSYSAPKRQGGGLRGVFARARRSAFIKNVAVLASGTAVAQAIIVLAAPVLSRLYSPTAFGVMSVVLAVGGPIAIVASLKYELAIVLAKNEKDARNIFMFSTALVLFVTAVTILAMPIAGPWLAEEMERPTAAPLMTWIPAFVLFQGLFNVVLFWANRRKDYLWTSASMVGRSVGTVGVQIGLGLTVDIGAKGLIVGRVVGLMLATAVLAWTTVRREVRSILQAFDLRRMWELAREHDHFPKYNAPREGIVTLSSSIPSVFLALLYSPAAAGLYWFTIRLLDVPTTLIGIAVRRVFFERATRALHKGERIYPMLMKATAGLAALGLFPALVIILAGPDLFDAAFGDEWRGAGIYARWLIIWWYSSFCNVASAALVPVFRLQPLFLGIEIVGVVLRGGAIAVAVFFGDAVLAIALYSMVGFALNIYRTAHVMHFAKHRQDEVAA